MECIKLKLCYSKGCNNKAKPSKAVPAMEKSPKVDIAGGETAVPYCLKCRKEMDKKWDTSSTDSTESTENQDA